MRFEWYSITKRLPTEEDIKKNGGSDFFVSALSGERGIPYTTTYVCGYDIHNNCWDACDADIITHWGLKPQPVPIDNIPYNPYPSA